MKRNKFERLLSGLLAFVMIMGMIPATAFAAEKAEIVTELDSEQLTQGRAADGNASFRCGIEYRFGGGIYNTEIYPEPSDALKEKYPVGKDVTSWFVGGLPEGLTARISDYYGSATGQSHVRPYIEIGLYGIPTETTTGRAVTITVPGDFYQDSQPVSFHSTIIIDPLGSACDGCTFETINGMQVCYKEGSGIHVCETNFGDERNTVGEKYDKDPTRNGYISAEEEPSYMTDVRSFWYFFDIEEVDSDSSGFFYLDRFANLGTVNIESGGVVFLGENNTKLESIITDGADVKGLDKIPSSAPLQEIEIKNATVDRYNYNFPMLEKLVLTDSVIDGEADDQIFITKDCAALKHIDLNGTNNERGGYTTLVHAPETLEYIDISNTNTEGLYITRFPNLKYFYAENNGMEFIAGASGESDKTLADYCPKLIEVDVSGNNLTKFAVGAHPTLKKLDLSNNKFTAFSAQNLPALKEFRINQQNEAGIYTNELTALYVKDCPQLELLEASYQMNPSFDVALENLPNLKELDMTECVRLTTIPADVAAVVEILKINNCTGLNEQFTAARYPKLKELYAKNVTIGNNDNGTRGLFVSAPNVEVIEYNDTKTAEFIELRGTAKLYMFVTEGSSKLKSIKISGADRLQKLFIANNPNLSELTLTGTKELRALDVFNDDSLTVIDFTDCWSIERVAASNDIRTLHPDNAPATFKGWRVAKGNKDLSTNDDLKGTDELEWVDSRILFYCHPDTVWGTENWNLAEWDTGKTTRISPFYNEGGYNGSPYQQSEYPSLFIAEPYKVTFNLSPYKESSEVIYSYYATEALSGRAVDMPGLVGWATKEFATESEIAYRPGDMIYLTEGKDLELWPVYNTETIVYYSAGNYSEYIGWNMKADEVDGLEEWRSYEYKHTFYGKSSLSKSWTYNILDLKPTREGYIFKGWYISSDREKLYNAGDEIESSEKQITLYAKWEKQVEMPSAYTYLSCDKDYFKKGDTVKLTAKIVGLNGADVSGTQFNAFLYLYEEGKENEKTKVAERVFTGDEVDLTFTYPADDTRIAYVEIFAYTGGDYSQKSITDDYKLTPAKAMDVEFKYSIGDGYVTVTEDTTIVLPQGANDGKLNIEVDALGGKGDLNIRLYEINSNVTVGTAIDNVVSTNTIGTKNYRASVSDETGNTVYTKQLTVKIVPELEVTDMSDDVEIANAQDVNFTIEYVGYNITPTLTNSNGSAVSGLEIVNRPGNERNGYTGTVAFVIPVPAPASGDTAEYAYEAVLVDEFGNDYYYEFHVYFDKTKGLTFAADGRGTLKFYDNYDKGEYANVFASGTDVAAELDGGWIYDIMDSLYASDRNQRPDNVLIPTVGDGVEVSVKLLRYDSYEAYKNGGAVTNVYQSDEFLSEMLEFDSDGYADISDEYGASVEYIPGKIDLFGDMTPGYYSMSLSVKNASAVGQYDEGYCFDIKGTERWSATGDFEILADVSQHVHDYKIDLSTGNFDDETPHTHSYKCYCGASYEEDHVYPAAQADDLPWLNFMMNGYDTNVERRFCTLCGGGGYRWRFLESFTIDNADLQEGKTNAYEKVMEAEQTLDIIAKLDFIEYVDTRVSQNTQDLYNGMASAFYPVNTKVNWTSSNQDVATVDENGVVTTVGEGTALITATTVQPGKETGEPMTATILISVNCQHAKHMVKVPAKDPTCQADGHVEHYMCLDCTKYSLTGDFTDTVSYENDIKIAQVDHAKLYGVWHADANGHRRECKYECGTKFDEGTHYSNESANCQHPEYCATCDYVLAPITAHSHNTYGWSDGYHWSICECGVVVEGSNEVHQFGADGSSDTCNDCGYKKNVGYTVSGTITSYLKNEGDITVQLLSGEVIAYSQVFNTYTEVNASRKEYSTVYSIPAVVDGNYTLRISKANHVTRDYTVTVNGGVLTQDAKIHLKGDITGDGQINIMDVNRANLHFKKKITLTGYEFACANVTGDTQVNIMDVNRMNLHFKGKSKLW